MTRKDTNVRPFSAAEKTEVFLELFGNSEIRHQTDAKLKQIAARLSRAITDSLDTDARIHPCLDTSLLKVNGQHDERQGT